MAGWVGYYEDDYIGAVWGGETSSEIGDGWVTLVQMARLVMPKLWRYIEVVQENAWRRDLKDEPEPDER